MLDIDTKIIVKQIFHRGSTTGKGTATDWAYCTQANPCGAGQGDCDNDRQCRPGLLCGFDNCKNFHPGAHRLADCCEQPPCKLRHTLGIEIGDCDPGLWVGTGLRIADWACGL